MIAFRFTVSQFGLLHRIVVRIKREGSNLLYIVFEFTGKTAYKCK